jgi:pSer/pThr/pTyr-binding forkhead associated (FHA) protein
LPQLSAVSFCKIDKKSKNMEKSAYQTPPWAALAAPEGYSLKILKGGVIIGSVPLESKTHFILGRMTGHVDILMEHVSISRQHCCLQFRDDGALMVLDLGSAQGSFLNKKKLEIDTYLKVNVGDMLAFGVSTRLYIVEGPAEEMPSEYDSTNTKLYRQKLLQHTANVEAKKLEAENAGVSWGFDEDAENPKSDEEDEKEEPDYIKNDENYDRKHGKKFTADLAESGNNEKDVAVLQKIRLKEKKIQNMQEEISRIYMKVRVSVRVRVRVSLPAEFY